MGRLANLNPQSLKDHPAQKKVYGDTADAELVASVRESGVIEPLVILKDGTIISGHRRRAAAVECELETVPCLIDDETDPADELASGDRFLSANVQREKTPEQKAREYKFRKELESERAKRRMQAGGQSAGRGRPQQGVQDLAHPIPGKGKAREIAAKAVGMSHQHAERALTVVKEIDKAEEAGDKGRAEELRETLNNKSVNAAFEKATGQLTGKVGRKALSAEKEVPTSGRKRPAPEEDEAGDDAEVKRQGVGVIHANEAINCLIRIPKNDPLRKRGFQIVTDWIKRNP